MYFTALVTYQNQPQICFLEVHQEEPVFGKSTNNTGLTAAI